MQTPLTTDTQECNQLLQEMMLNVGKITLILKQLESNLSHTSASRMLPAPSSSANVLETNAPRMLLAPGSSADVIKTDAPRTRQKAKVLPKVKAPKTMRLEDMTLSDRIPDLNAKIFGGNGQRVLDLLEEYPDVVEWYEKYISPEQLAASGNAAQAKMPKEGSRVYNSILELDRKLGDAFQTLRLLEDYPDIVHSHNMYVRSIRPATLPHKLQLLLKKKNQAMRDCTAFPSPENEKLVKELKQEAKKQSQEFFSQAGGKETEKAGKRS